MPDENKDHGKIILQWKFPEFNQYQRTKGWYIGAALVVILLIIFAFAQGKGGWLFALVIIMSVLVILMLHKNAREIDFTIYEDGTMIGDQFFDWKEIEQFYIIYEPPEIKSLYFEFKSIFSPRAPINLMDQDPVEVRDILLEVIPEDLDREHEPFSDQIARMLRL